VVVAAYLKLKPALTVVVAAFDLIPDASWAEDASRKNQLEFHLHQEEETPFRLESGWGWKAGLAASGLTAACVLLASSRASVRVCSWRQLAAACS
jgi:hypothetical protein